MKLLFIILLFPIVANSQFTTSQVKYITDKLKPITDKATLQGTQITSITSKNTVQDNAIASIVNRNTIQDATLANLATSISSLTSKNNALELRIKKLEDSITVMVKKLSSDFSYDINGQLIISSTGIERTKQAILNPQ